MGVTEQVLTIAVVVFGTMTTRFLPFLLFPAQKTPPPFIQFLGKVLPGAVIGLLVVYSLKDSFQGSYKGLPEILAILVIVLVHRWRKNTLLSIGTGTVLYMLLIQNFFV